MTPERTDQGVVQAVVVYDGRLLLAEGPDGWALPTGGREPAERAEAAAARLVYELTGYLVDGSTVLPSGPEHADSPDAQDGPDGLAGPHAAEGAVGARDAVPAVVCQLLSETPSDDARLAPAQRRWMPLAEAARVPLPGAVRRYLEGHASV
ncbi:NUDIX domain-containing protein [Streptomyces tropicalis]|uniref:NUDIX domain-containing protein n=1 Tax=Streptomyces tropicalis TaxID=3034234 RepID=A0ABT6A6L5_9ACTN|nr:NUDIX domain-containing protein [Streptomyces tropicalis]MDF3300279.1 NUDIX domain-containing protein [Streptomyces tropicalis]